MLCLEVRESYSLFIPLYRGKEGIHSQIKSQLFIN